MAVTQTCKALKFVPVRENFDRAKVTEQLKDLRSLTAITQPRVLGIFLQVSTKLTALSHSGYKKISHHIY